MDHRRGGGDDGRPFALRQLTVRVPRHAAAQGGQRSKAEAEQGQRDRHALITVVLALILEATRLPDPCLASTIDDGPEDDRSRQVAERFSDRRLEPEREGTMRRLNAVQRALQGRHDHAARHEHHDERAAERDHQINCTLTLFAPTCRHRSLAWARIRRAMLTDTDRAVLRQTETISIFSLEYFRAAQ